MTWIAVAELLLKYGPDLVDKIIKNSQNNTPVTPAEWDEVKKCIPFDTLVPKKANP